MLLPQILFPPTMFHPFCLPLVLSWSSMLFVSKGVLSTCDKEFRGYRVQNRRQYRVNCKLLKWLIESHWACCHGKSAWSYHNADCWEALCQGGLMSKGCCKKLPQNGWLERAEIYSLSVPEAKGYRSRCQQGGCFLKNLGGRFHACLLASGGCWQSLACRQATPASASVSTSHSPLCICDSECKFPSNKDSSHIGFRAHPHPV